MWRRRMSSVSTHNTDIPREVNQQNNYIVISSDKEENDDRSSLSEDEWYINCILDETESQYLIDWEGPWSPSWEPKEHASESAIQAWEEKKQIHSVNKTQNTEISETPTGVKDTQDHSVESTDSAEHLAQQRGDSPLFIPSDSLAGSVLFLRNDRWSEIPESGQVTPTTPEIPESAPWCSDPAVPLTSAVTPSGATCVFEYTSTTPIPLEYLLPSEIEGYLATQETGSSRLPLTTAAGETPESDDLLTPEAAKRSQLPHSAVSAITQDTPRDPVHPRHSELDGVAETPPISLTVSESQYSLQRSATSNPQKTLTPIGRCSGYSSLVSQLLASKSPSSGCIQARVGSAVPESLSNTPQHSTNPRSQILKPKATVLVRHACLVPGSSARTMSGPSQKKEAPTLAQTMEKYSQYEGATPREKLKNAYAQLSAKASSFQGIEASVTPSSTEDIEPSVPASVPEMAPPLSVRVDKDHSFHQPEPAMNPPSPEPLEEPGQQPTPQTIQPSALTVNHSDEVSPGSVHLGSSEFAVPLPMDSRVKDDYERALLAETQGIREFLKGHTTPETLSELEHGRLVVKIREVLNSLSNVATHPDLRIADHIKSMDSDLSKEADWAQYSSAKFLFLGYLVEIAGNQDVHLVIMVSGEKTQNVVERYLLGKGLVYSRPREEMGPGTNLEISLVKGPLSFGIQTTSNEGVTETYKSPSAIIALDPSLNVKSPSVEHMRTTFARNGSLLPVIRLIVSNSSEHIELCFPKAQELLRLQLTMQYTVRFRDMVGELQDDALGVREDAEEILSWLLSDRFNKNWPLAPIEPLQLTSTDELLSTQLEAPTPETVSSTASSNSHAQKRLLTDDSGEHSSKRLRVELSQDNTQLTESTKFPSQTLDSGLHALETNLMQMQTAHAAEIEKFQKTLDEMRTRLQERDQQLESLQHRYETRTKEVHKFRRERDQLANSKTTSEQKMEKQREEINKLKNERTQLRHELEQSRAELKSEGGKMAELETAREEIRRLTKEKTGLERKAEYEAKQAEYTREQYQNASNTAAQTGNEVRQLREDNQSLTRKVEGNALRLREINMKSDEDRHLLRIAELESTLAMREDLLRRKEDELREIRKNRPSTRSTSTQPRSPRLTAGSRPTSPGINNHNGRGSALRYSSEMPA